MSRVDTGLKMLRQHEVFIYLTILLERRIDELYNDRHDFPIWPQYGNPSDEYERIWHGTIRHSHYEYTKFLIHLLRKVREAQ